ncbi:hypothetical protein BX666DRAFT_2019438 [Dichotomocladium elegans]|nr:hypothetical protein BX666DRAFT_2019438 [Dichotomocladium elegans]
MAQADYSKILHHDGDEPSTSSSLAPSIPDKGRFDRAWQWLSKMAGTTKGEYAPLIDRGKGTLELPRLTFRKVVVTVTLIVVSLGILGGILVSCLFRRNYVRVDASRWILEIPDSRNIRAYLQYYTNETHLAGSEADQQQADWTKQKFIEFGIRDTKIETYYPLLNYPLDRRLALVSGPPEFQYEASLEEKVVPEDESSSLPERTPTFHGYSKNGTAFGPVVYANYGRVEDFEYLVSQGVHLNGTIALMRYGGAFRGLKIRAAEQYGCIGALVYSDPLDDGPIGKEGFPHMNPPKPYPEGPWRSPSSVQRGSVQYNSILTGDPTTPGWAATKDAKRVPRDESPGVPQIPSLPLSYEDALPLLKATDGRGTCDGEGWRGGSSEVQYCSGPSEGYLDLVNIVEDKITPIWNVIGRIEGKEEPDRVVILGNHRDAWVFGAVDPSSGSAIMLELARTLGILLEKGWRPRRTIILASWDAEEFGMVGSTEWVEDHREWLNSQAVAYLNVDMAVAGPFFTAAASPSLNRLLYEVAALVPAPEDKNPYGHKTIYESWYDYTNRTQQTISPPPERPTIRSLGSGSDFVAFVSHVGVASMDIAFEGDYGIYHSNYDSFHWMEKFGDPTFAYHQAMCRIWGLLALRLADDRILPMSPRDYSAVIKDYVDRLADDDNSATYEPLVRAAKKLHKRARKFAKHQEELSEALQSYVDYDDTVLPPDMIASLNVTNQRAMYFERGFTSVEGLKGREWFKHIIYAPHMQTGYASQFFPAVADALASNSTEWIGEAIEQTAGGIRAAAEKLNSYDIGDDDDKDVSLL